MDVEQILSDYRIPHTTEGAHTTAGWVNVDCPFCPSDTEHHLGINVERGVGHCWRCGSHSPITTFSRLLNLSASEVHRILDRYERSPIRRRSVAEPRVAIHPLKLPSPHGPLNGHGKAYLAKRKFDPERLEREWSLLQTGPVSFLDGVSYAQRILIPVYWNTNGKSQMVSFQGRDITNRSALRYLTCPIKRERVHHKDVLYGRQERWQTFGGLIVVEGVTDVWRLGPCAAATFGIEFKMTQVLQLAKAHERFFIVFDDEPQAQRQARKLAIKLKALGKWARVETIEGDPGSMRQDDANYFVKNLLGKGV